MNRDVQRTFVLLRQLGTGRESGYARAEARDGKVRLNIVVQGFADTETAPSAFATTQDGLLYLGQLNIDARGQGGISLELSGNDLRRMQVLFIAMVVQDGVSIPLAGTIGRGSWVDWTEITQQVEDVLLPQKAEQNAQSAPIEEPVQQEQIIVQQETAPEQEIVQEEPQQEIVQEDVAVQPPSVQETEPEATQEELIYDLPAQEDPFEVVERSLRTPLPEEGKLEMPQCLRDAYWPQILWPLHDLYERFERVYPFTQVENMVYIRIPLGDAAIGMDHYLIGVRIEEGWVTGVGYLIPGVKSAKAPAAMSAYEWKDGYWQAWQFVENAQ